MQARRGLKNTHHQIDCLIIPMQNIENNLNIMADILAINSTG